MPAKFLHALVVYTVAGVTLTYLLTKGAGFYLKLRKPGAQIQLLLLTLAMPYLAYFFHRFFSPILELEHGARFFEPANRFFAWLCSLGNLGSTLYLPLISLVAFTLYRFCRYAAGIKNINRQAMAETGQGALRAQRILSSLAQKAKLKTPRLKVLERKDYCCFAYGVWRPCVAISRRLLEELSDEELQSILAHELAHVAHRDGLKRCLANILRDLSFYLPITHWVVNSLQDQQELAADDWAMQLTGKPLEYAAVLLKVWRLNRGQAWDAGVTGVLSFTAEVRISDRAERILREEAQAPGGAPLWLVTAIGAMVIAVLAYVC